MENHFLLIFNWYVKSFFVNIFTSIKYNFYNIYNKKVYNIV